MATTASGEFPQPFGKYRLLRKLARGGMAELFLATDETHRGPVVIKRVLPHFTQDTEFLKMFLNEARIAALLNHPGIVQVFDLGKEEEHLFIAMEFVDGFDLETLTKLCGGRLPPLIAARVGADVCDALYYANRVTDLEGKPLNIVHRDVTPGNVMITRKGEAKLVDFGVAKAAAQLERTRPGVVKGKFRYMSPEQVTFKELDGRTDLFSLGVLLYEVTTGERPFERKQIIDIIRAITDWMPPAPTEVVKGYPRPLSLVILKALEKDRDRRYRNAREMQTALEQALTKTPTTKADLANFISELARAHPKELAPVAPEFSKASDKPDPTDPIRPSRMAEVDARDKAAAPRTSSRADSPLNSNAAAGRTEAIPGDEVKRMIAAADRRAAAARTSSKPGNARSFTVGPPKEDEATAQGQEEEEETTTNPVSPPRRLSSARPPPPVRLEPRRPFLEGKAEDEPLVGDDGPSTERRIGMQIPGDLAGLGSDDDLDAPTVSNADGVPGSSTSRISQTSSISEFSVTATKRRARRRFLLLFTALCLLATLVFLILTLLARAPPETPEHLKDGVNLGKQPVDKNPAPPGGEPAATPGEAPDDTGAVAAEPKPGEPFGTVAVDGQQGTRVSLGGRAFQDVPTRFNLAPGHYNCFYQRGGKKKPCRNATVAVEVGKPTSIHVP